MTNKKNRLDIFIEESEKIRKTPIPQWKIDKINNISKEIDEMEDDQELDIPAAAKQADDINP